MELHKRSEKLKNILLSLSVIVSIFGIIISSIVIYPLFESGFSAIANEYPNSKVYLLSVIKDSAGINAIEIVGMDLTTKNLIIVSVPTDLSINGQIISNIYQTKGIEQMEKAIEEVTNLKMTDWLVSTKSALEGYQSGLQYQTIEDLIKIIEKEKTQDPLSLFYSFKNFSSQFKSSINFTRFVRIIHFIQTKPSIFKIEYPYIYSNGTFVTNTNALKNFAMEMENCTPFYNPFSIKPVIINCSDQNPSTFYQTNMNLWSKNGYDFEIIPDLFGKFKGENIVISLSDSSWKLDAIKSALSKIYPNIKFTFVSASTPEFLKTYYDIVDWASSKRYYSIGKYDFLILLGHSS